MRRTNLTSLLVVAVGFAVLSGCSKSTPDKTETDTVSKPALSEKAPAAPAKIERSVTAATNRARKELPPVAKPGVLEKDYRTATNDFRKTEIIYKLGEVGSREAVGVLGRLFQFEKDDELKTEMISILSVVDEADSEKIAVYKLGVKSDQSVDVRKEAIDGLSDIEDLRVIPILQELTKDPNSEIGDAAREALEYVQSSVTTP